MIHRWITPVFLCLLIGCDAKPAIEKPVQLPAGVVFQDKIFHSGALQRDVTYRVIRPASIPAASQAHVLYLLHGNGSGFREWSQYSAISQLATQGYVLVMPEGHSTYFMNSASKPQDQYEDYLTRDLIRDAEKDLPAPPDRAHRAIAGVSMGGFAAVVIGLEHPDLYGFAGALSPPIDAAGRRFTFRRLSQSLGFRSIFGPSGSDERRAKDPFVLAHTVDPRQAPYIFLPVGEQESLAAPVRAYDAQLTRQHLPHEFQTLPGGHDWAQWNRQLPAFESALAAHAP
ncbi:S-formylglutathione hydrolase FrmB [Granulicella rosea]|uniref:S-formylglutathione hydrolase FrmB n=1 Tax=Granulicella rosea TaxID=474952 RepID=A0A239HMQ7_9BACT|nr:alpha/beta hydrolase-fold protein [Granulicella rosea]SNS82123.1 S-formylglutathione hydrolase FrmB [Granulicella rosea]